ncbi:hypothetical protein V2J09_008497 [Rumex salicifolius]
MDMEIQVQVVFLEGGSTGGMKSQNPTTRELRQMPNLTKALNRRDSKCCYERFLPIDEHTFLRALCKQAEVEVPSSLLVYFKPPCTDLSVWKASEENYRSIPVELT